MRICDRSLIVMRRVVVGLCEVLAVVVVIGDGEVVVVVLDERFQCGCPIDRCRARC